MLKTSYDFLPRTERNLLLSPSDQLEQSFFEAFHSTRGLIMASILTLAACSSDTASSSESHSSGSETTTGPSIGTDSHSSTSTPGGTEPLPTSMPQPEITTDVSTSSDIETMTGSTTEMASTTGMPMSCDLGGVECFGTCLNDQCLCDNPCYAGGDKNCRDECAEGCIDQGVDPGHPDCVPENPEILPAPVIWTSSFSTKKSEAPFFLEGVTHPETQFLTVSIEGSPHKMIEAPVFVPGEPHWGGNSEHFVLPAYDGDFYNVCFTAVKNGIFSEEACVVLAANPNAFIVKLRGLLTHVMHLSKSSVNSHD